MSYNKENIIELSIVMPCLNEQDTIGICIAKAEKIISENNINAEIIIADNGSTDASKEIINKTSARFIEVSEKGYGHALIAGINDAKGKFVIMGDADDSYDFLEIMKILNELRSGYDLVNGCRFSSKGGTIKKNAMPLLHKYLGNPLFSLLSRFMFKSKLYDPYCGFRGFTKQCYKYLSLKCTGMEFAVEMILKASLYNVKVSEVPITLWPDGRKSHPPHLRTFRDGWRTLRFFLLMSPFYLYFFPGIIILLTGLTGYFFVLFKLTLFKNISLDINTLLFMALFVSSGYQIINTGLFARTFSAVSGLLPANQRLKIFYKYATLEKGIAFSLILFSAGICLFLYNFNVWHQVNFKNLSYPISMRISISSFLLIMLSIQTFFTSFLISSIGINIKN